MPRLDIAGDARRIFDVLQDGGIAIWPNDTGYGLLGGSTAAAQRIFETKRRGSHKRNALICDLHSEREIHRLDSRAREIVEAITVDYDLPLGAIGLYDPDHPLMRNVDPVLLKASTANGTIGMLLNAGPFYDELCRLIRENAHPVFGSSANLTGTGTKFRIEDIQPELRAIADIEIDYGLRKYHAYRRSATIIDFTRGVEILRIGTCYELIADVLTRDFGIECPPDPGREALPSGHLNEFMLVDAQ